MLRQESTNYSEFRDDFAGQFDRMSKSKSPTVVLKKGRVAAAVLSPRDYERFLEDREQREVIEAIEQGRRDFAAGKGISLAEFRKRMRAMVKNRESSIKATTPASVRSARGKKEKKRS